MKVHVTAKAGAKQASVKQVDAAEFVVTVRERAHDGKANEAIARALADHYNIAPSKVILVRGARSRIKTFEVYV